MAWNKFRAVKTKVGDKTFPSKLEAATYNMLLTLLRTGEIISIECQSKVYLTDAKILFIVDFKCTRQDGSVYWVESKGKPLPSYQIKRRLWIAGYGPGELQVYGGSADRLVLSEILVSGQKPRKSNPRASNRRSKNKKI